MGVAGCCSAMDSEMLIFVPMTKMTMKITTCNLQWGTEFPTDEVLRKVSIQ